MSTKRSWRLTSGISLVLLLATACNLEASTPTTVPPNATVKPSIIVPSVTIPIPINHPPSAKDVSIDIVQESHTSIDLKTLASDPDGNPLTFTVNTLAEHGTTHLAASTLAFTPTAEYVGPDSIKYEVSDGKGGTAQGTVKITVNSIAPPLVSSEVIDFANATEFLYSGSNPTQTGVVSGTIEAKRVAVLRGKVTTRDGNPLVGVEISILDHPEYGQTLTRASGCVTSYSRSLNTRLQHSHFGALGSLPQPGHIRTSVRTRKLDDTTAPAGCSIWLSMEAVGSHSVIPRKRICLHNVR